MNKFIEYFRNLEKKQKYMLYLSVVFVGYMVFNQFVPEMMDKQESLQSDIQTKQMQIIRNSTKKLKAQVAKVQKELLISQENVSMRQERVNYLIGSLYRVKFAFFREEELAKALDLVLQNSIRKNIELAFIKNEDAKIENLSELIQYKKTMLIDGNGEYKQILEFINYIENLELLMSIAEVQLEEAEKKDNVHFSLKVNFYGVGL